MKKTILLVAALSVSSCTVVGDMDTDEKYMTIAGTAIGGIIGYQFGDGALRLLSTGVGAAIGGISGLTLARNMTTSDRWAFDKTAAATLDHGPTGQTQGWNNPETGNNGSFTPVRSYKGQGGFTCRDVYITVSGNEGFQLEKMSACQQPDGAWRFVGGWKSGANY
ncbi:MAG: RT0821/Lpp0805 family surface protein [Rhodospirillales bacterium]|nr:RT0821/Lpp0805 family surface protein [Rhodospirillales bacterium]